MRSIFSRNPRPPKRCAGVVAEVIDRHAAAPVPSGAQEPGPKQPDVAKQPRFDLARAKRAINRGQFSEAETVLREIITLEPKSTAAHELNDRLQKLKEQESARVVPHSARLVSQRSFRGHEMTSLATLTLGLAFFALFFWMVAACNRL